MATWYDQKTGFGVLQIAAPYSSMEILESEHLVVTKTLEIKRWRARRVTRSRPQDRRRFSRLIGQARKASQIIGGKIYEAGSLRVLAWTEPDPGVYMMGNKLLCHPATKARLLDAIGFGVCEVIPNGHAGSGNDWLKARTEREYSWTPSLFDELIAREAIQEVRWPVMGPWDENTATE